ncbi:chorismate mutase [Maledivibacter halophilus]|uniref:Bifunctional chorismate mutase/prephenate dehydratase n=1 Tax=Maledivibacter halophilus TaxID=36842 RepID=A0A1T5LZR7_9FIRM|nr:chorismate mutase [Maledivibacter halophilus]SKC81294.1 chorismate mutase [Maledivibacter halophilus]
MNELENLRREIDKVDKEIVASFEKRMETVLKIAKYKEKNNIEIFNQAREIEVLKKNILRLKNKRFEKSTERFLNKLMEISRDIQKEHLSDDRGRFFVMEKLDKEPSPVKPSPVNIRVGYQGEPGSFSEEALTQYFKGNVSTHNVREFEDVFEALKKDKIDYGVLPIENSSTGGISEVYDLLRKYGFYIIGERCIKVQHNLAAMKNTKFHEIQEVYSHPQAFKQCGEFFKDYPNIRLIPYKNTAISAKYIGKEQSRSKAAVCSEKAAQLYDLEIIRGDINCNKSNYTRFIIIGKNLTIDNDCNKISIVTTTSHTPGALYKILGFFAKNNLNMMKIESRPIIGRSWEYFFYIDFSGNLNNNSVKQSIEDIEKSSSYFQLLGNYKEHSV